MGGVKEGERGKEMERWKGEKREKGGKEGEGGRERGRERSVTFSKLCWCPWKTFSCLSVAKGRTSHILTGFMSMYAHVYESVCTCSVHVFVCIKCVCMCK